MAWVVDPYPSVNSTNPTYTQVPYKEVTQIINIFMSFYVLYFILQAYTIYLGFRFLKKQRQKPKYKPLYYSSDEYIVSRKNMELAF